MTANLEHIKAGFNRMQTLYHYCSTSTFLAIVGSRTIRLSSLRQSNDTLEGRLLGRAISRLATKEGLSEVDTARLTEIEELYYSDLDGLGFCLSEEGDLLSQWRGYADNGEGLPVGFNLASLSQRFPELHREWLNPCHLEKIEYEPQGHDELVQPSFNQILTLVKNGALDFLRPKGLLDLRTDEEVANDNLVKIHAFKEVHEQIAGLYKVAYKLKTEAFSEEREWRIISYHLDGSNSPVKWHSRKNELVRYKDINSLPSDSISKVVIGPRHNTPPKVIAEILKKCGFDGVEVVHSRASYR